jgi:hypothetical protein
VVFKNGKIENICSVQQQPFETCRVRQIEEYTPRNYALINVLYLVHFVVLQAYNLKSPNLSLDEV